MQQVISDLAPLSGVAVGGDSNPRLTVVSHPDIHPYNPLHCNFFSLSLLRIRDCPY